MIAGVWFWNEYCCVDSICSLVEEGSISRVVPSMWWNLDLVLLNINIFFRAFLPLLSKFAVSIGFTLEQVVVKFLSWVANVSRWRIRPLEFFDRIELSHAATPLHLWTIRFSSIMARFCYSTWYIVFTLRKYVHCGHSCDAWLSVVAWIWMHKFILSSVFH